MLTLVTGGSASGKSEYAENLLCNLCKGNKLYIAAMQPQGPNDMEFDERVLRHRALRAGKGFRTAERYADLPGLPLEPCGGILLECLSNLCANEFFRTMELFGKDTGKKAVPRKHRNLKAGKEPPRENAAEALPPSEMAKKRTYTSITNGVERLCGKANSVVVVTNEIFSDGCSYTEPTLSYIRLMGELNVALAARADCVVEVVCGIPVVHKNKGGWPL